MLRRLLKLFGLLLGGAALSVIAYVLWAVLAWGDIPLETLTQRYASGDLERVTLDGVDLHYRLSGNPATQPVVVLIHNHFMDMGMWDSWVEQLDQDYAVLRYDLSGHGLTGPDPSGIYTVPRDVTLLRDLLDALKIGPVHLVGSSLGGNIAFAFAAQQPQRTSSLTLINSGGLIRPGSNSQRSMPEWADMVFPLIPPIALHRFVEWMVAAPQDLSPAFKTRFVDMFRRQGNRSAELARLRQFDSGNPDPVLAKVRAPTLILWGEDNPQLPASLAEQFKRKLSQAESVHVRIIANAGHVLPYERPLASVQAFKAFVEP